MSAAGTHEKTHEHPADLIDQSGAIITFLSLVIGECNKDMGMTVRDQEGLCYILNHVNDNLNQAMNLL